MSKNYSCNDDSIHFSKIPTKSNFFRKNGSKKYAMVTMLIINDSYLPAIIMLAQSLQNVSEKLRKYIDLVCLVTPDISPNARDDISKFYDRIIGVPYLQVPAGFLTHKKHDIREIYSKTFTKIQCLTLYDYDKVVFCDADMLILHKNFYNLFTLKTPAGVYFGCYRPFYNDYQYNKYLSTICPKVKHGELIDMKMFHKYCQREADQNIVYLGVESSIMVLSPSKKEYDNIIQALKHIKPYQYSGDSLFISKYFEGRWHYIDIRFLGRWIMPNEHPELITFDLYGTEGKPWQINKLNDLLKYKDLQFWWHEYAKLYPKHFKHTVHDPAMHELFTKLPI